MFTCWVAVADQNVAGIWSTTIILTARGLGFQSGLQSRQIANGAAAAGKTLGQILKKRSQIDVVTCGDWLAVWNMNFINNPNSWECHHPN